MTSKTKNYKTATILAIITALAGALVGASTQGNEHMVLAYKGFFRGLAHIKGDHGKQGIQRPTNIDEKAICETAGENSPIHASCNNTATTGTTDTDGRITTNTDGRITTIIGGSSSTSNTGRITGTIRLPFEGFP